MKVSALNMWIKRRFQSNNFQLETNLIAEHNREILVKQGRDQFKELLDRGLNIPVALL